MYLKFLYSLIFLFMIEDTIAQSLNVFGQPLELCCDNPKTGFYRDGFRNTGSIDLGTHVVCAEMTKEFLDYTKSKGNDLSSLNRILYLGLCFLIRFASKSKASLSFDVVVISSFFV